jgi:hypothetical protein
MRGLEKPPALSLARHFRHFGNVCRKAAVIATMAGRDVTGVGVMADYLLDCNHLSAAIRKTSGLRDRIHQARRTGHRFISCYPVLCELEAGIQQTAKPKRIAV